MAKKLGRSELLNWINSITQSDYPKIENLSDGVGYCQIMDAFFNNCGNEIMKLKLNSKEVEDYQKNFNLLNIMLGKQKSFKQVDPIKMTKFKELDKHPVAEVEQSIIDSWGGTEAIYNDSVANRLKAKKWVFYDGPATANGMPGIHHMMAKVIKDTIESLEV